MQRECAFGNYNLNEKAGYTITAKDKLVEPWYYIYQNRKILLYLDQNGPVKIQHNPPSGVLIIKRELGEKTSKWQTFVQSKDINNGIAVSNFDRPRLTQNMEKPITKVEFTPDRAKYISKYKNADIITEIFVPHDKATVSMKTTIVNKMDKTLDAVVIPGVFPYINVPQMVAWDLPEWYLSVKARLNKNAFTFCGKMTDPLMIKENERSVTFNVDYDDNAQFELNMTNFVKTGDFFCPQTVIENLDLCYSMKDADSTPVLGSVPAVFAAKYNCAIPAGESKTFTQVMTVQEDYDYNETENNFDLAYFDESKYLERVNATKSFYEELFTKRTIKTSNELYDNFINNFAPLQMYWVCSLDRGWPSSMRGTRDASQDFMGMLPLDTEWTKKVIKELFEHQRTDGWYPRQVSTISREAPHDMRYFSDGGAFLLELVNEYLTFTRDYNFLDEKVYWLNSDEESTVLEHIERTIDFYLDEKNIGEHGLCKVWYGDWWDPMDQIGMDGIGETVTVTAQNVLNLKYLSDMFKWLYEVKEKNDRYLDLSDKYLAARENFIQAMRKHAFNKNGFFNGYYNDNRKWLFSDNDPDGRERLYLVSNAWAIISGVADEDMTKSVIDNIIKQSWTDRGILTNSKGFPEKVDKAGRKGNGTQPNGATYNHAQSFFVRACCEAGRPDLAYQATKYLLPIDSEHAPVEKTFAPPYAIVNLYSKNYRAGFQFLSGTVSYVLRTVYNFFFGVKYEYNGLTVKPSIPKEFGDCEIELTYLNKRIVIKAKLENREKALITVNGELSNDSKIFIPDEKLKDNNLIEIKY